VPNGPHPDNLRGKIALEQLRAIKEVTWPGVQGDIERNRVVELPVVDVVHCDESLSPVSSSYGIRRRGDEPPIPLAPGLEAHRGRYRAWVLPISGVAVALEALDDEATYLRDHRRDLLEIQHVDEADLVPLTELRLRGSMVCGAMGPRSLIAFLRRLTNRPIDGYYEGPFERRWRSHPQLEPAYRQLVLGTTYRMRPATTTWHWVIEPVVANDESFRVGPYR
jgi:hypothetical protein